MSVNISKLALTSYEDIFKSDELRKDDKREKVIEMPLSELYPFENHPFRVCDDDEMHDMTESIEKYGILVPCIARPREAGGYELIAGHRRKRACELIGNETIPVIIRELDNDEAIIIMIDSNLQRETLLFSEKAFAYKMKLDAIKRQSGRQPKENGSQVRINSFNKKSYDIIAEQSGESKNQVYRSGLKGKSLNHISIIIQ